MDKKFILQLIKLGLATLDIDGKEVKCDSLFIEGNDIYINDDEHYDRLNTKIRVKNISVKKLKDFILKVENLFSILPDSGDFDYRKLKAIELLRNLDNLDNDLSRIDYLIDSNILVDDIFNDHNEVLEVEPIPEDDDDDGFIDF
jgi:hypothetical protein